MKKTLFLALFLATFLALSCAGQSQSSQLMGYWAAYESDDYEPINFKQVNGKLYLAYDKYEEALLVRDIFDVGDKHYMLVTGEVNPMLIRFVLKKDKLTMYIDNESEIIQYYR